jgi:hypothetical protein
MYQCQACGKDIRKKKTYTYILLVFLFLLLAVIHINCLKLSQQQTSNEIHLEAPHLTDKFHSNRPPIKPSTNITGTRIRTRTKPKTIASKDLINPCNGAYRKTNGTTCGLQDIMIGRCYEYEYVKRGFYLTNQS